MKIKKKECMLSNISMLYEIFGLLSDNERHFKINLSTFKVLLTLCFLQRCKQKQLAEFECSKDNALHSIATYYTSGVMGKRKYQAVRLAPSMKSSDSKKGVRQLSSLCQTVLHQNVSLIVLLFMKLKRLI